MGSVDMPKSARDKMKEDVVGGQPEQNEIPLPDFLKNEDDGKENSSADEIPLPSFLKKKADGNGSKFGVNPFDYKAQSQPDPNKWVKTSNQNGLVTMDTKNIDYSGVENVLSEAKRAHDALFKAKDDQKVRNILRPMLYTDEDRKETEVDIANATIYVKQAEDAKNAYLKANAHLFREPINNVVSNGGYKKFLTKNGVFDYEAGINFANDFVSKHKGGTYASTAMLYALKSAVEFEKDRPRYNEILNDEYKKAGIDIGKLQNELIEKAVAPKTKYLDKIKEESFKEGGLINNEALELAKQEGEKYTSRVNELKQLWTSGSISEDEANARLQSINSEYLAAIKKIDDDRFQSLSFLRDKKTEKYNRIRKEVESIYNQPFDEIIKSLSKEEQEKIKRAHENAWSRLEAEKQSVKRAEDIAYTIEGISELNPLKNIFTKSLISGWHIGLADIGDWLIFKGLDGGLSKKLRAHRTKGEEWETAEYSWDKDWLLRAMTSSGSSFGASLPTMIPTMAATLLTGGAGGVVLGGVVGWAGENIQNTGGMWHQLLSEGKDPVEAAVRSENFSREQIKSLPAYFLQSLGIQKIVRNGLANFIVGAGLELGEEEFVEHFQGYTQDVASGKFNGKFSGWVRAHPDLKLDVLAGVIGQSTIMKAGSKIYESIFSKAPSAQEQFYANMINNGGVEVALKNLRQRLDNDIITTDEYKKEKAKIDNVVYTWGKVKELGLKGDDALAYIAYSKDIDRLIEERDSQKDQSLKLLYNQRIIEKQQELTDIVSGKGVYAVVTMPGGNNTKVVVPVENIDDELIRSAETIEIKNDKLANKEIQDKKKMLGTPKDAPDGMYKQDQIKDESQIPQTDDQWKERIAAAETEEEKEQIMKEHGEWLIERAKTKDKTQSEQFPQKQPKAETKNDGGSSVVGEGKLDKPSAEQQLNDFKEGNVVTFEYENESEVPEVFKDKISSKGIINGKPYVKVTMAKSLADFYLQEQSLEEQPKAETKADVGSSVGGEVVVPENLKLGGIVKVAKNKAGNNFYILKSTTKWFGEINKFFKDNYGIDDVLYNFQYKKSKEVDANGYYTLPDGTRVKETADSKTGEITIYIQSEKFNPKAVEQLIKEQPKAEATQKQETGQQPKTEQQQEVKEASTEAESETKKQIEEFGVAKEDVDATHSLLNQVFSGLKKAGLTVANTVGEWVGIGKGEQKVDSLKQIIGEIGASQLENAEKVLDDLRIAKEMEAAGKDAKTIHLATSWERGVDGKWRFEIPDVEFKNIEDLLDDKEQSINTVMTIGQIVKDADAEELFDIYGVGIWNMKVLLNVSKNSLEHSGSYSVKDNIKTSGLGTKYKDGEIKMITVNGNFDTWKSILLHEIQHAIQDIEGFAKGGSPSQFKDTPIPKALKDRHFKWLMKASILQRKLEERGLKTSGNPLAVINLERSDVKQLIDKNPELKEEYNNVVEESKQFDKYLTKEDKYRRLSGEVEARNVENRMNMTLAERKAKMLSETEDINRDQQIIIRDAIEMKAGAESNRQPLFYGARRKAVGGNSGYVGYSMSKRAQQAYEDGKLPYSKLPAWAKRMVDAGMATTDEWHHTSSYGNKTPFYEVKQFFEHLTDAQKEDLGVENFERFSDVPKDVIKEIDVLAKDVLKKKNNIKELRKRYVDAAQKELDNFNAKFKRFSRQSRPPANALIQYSEMNGKYGWFESKSTYNLPEYHSGIDYETAENKEKAIELENKLKSAKNDPIYKIELLKRGFNENEIDSLKEYGVITSEVMPDSFYIIAEKNKDIIKDQIKELSKLPKPKEEFNPKFNRTIDSFLTEEEKRKRQARHNLISEQGEDFGSRYERKQAHEDNDRYYYEIAKERYNEERQRFINSKEVREQESKFNDDKNKAIEIIGNLKHLFSVEETRPLLKDAQAQYRIESGKNIIEAIKDFDGSPEATVALTHEIMHPTVVAIIDVAKEGNEVGKRHTKTIVDEYNKANPDNTVTEEELISDNDKFKEGITTDKYRAVQEFIAQSWEQYHREGAKGFSEAFQKVLEQIKRAFESVYKSISGKQLTPELRRFFDEILGKEEVGVDTKLVKDGGNANVKLDSDVGGAYGVGFAPYRSKNVSTIDEDVSVRNSEEYKLHQDILKRAAKGLGVEISKNRNTWGGYIDSETGVSVNEVSNVVTVNGDSEQVELLAAILGKATPEMQDSVLVGKYSESGGGVEYTIKTHGIENIKDAIKLLQKNGIQYYTIDINSGEIIILDIDNSNSENIINFTKDLQKNRIYAGTEYSKTDAKFIGQKDYDSIIDRGRLQTRTKTGFDIDAFIQEAKRKYEEIKSAANPANQADTKVAKPAYPEEKDDSKKMATKAGDVAKVGKYEEKARKLGEKILQAKLPDWLKADLPGNAKRQGISEEDIKRAFANAIIEIGKLLDKGVEFYDAVKAAAKELVSMLGEDRRESIENNLAQEYMDAFGVPPKEPPATGGRDEPNVGGRDRKKTLLSRFIDSDAVPDWIKEKIKGKTGLKYKVASKGEATTFANAIIDELGIDGAIDEAEKRTFFRGVNSAIFAQSINRIYSQILSAPDNQKAELRNYYASIVIRYDEWLRELGTEVEYVKEFYKKDAIGIIIAESIKRNNDFNEWYSEREKSFKEMYEELSKDPQFESLIKERVKEELKKERQKNRAKRISKVNDAIDKWIKDIENGGVAYSSFVPPKLLVEALRGIKAAYAAGEDIAEIIQNAIDYISDKLGYDTWDKDKFTERAKSILEGEKKADELYQARLIKQIEELNEQIASLKRKEKASKNKREYSDETKRLIEERDNKKKELDRLVPKTKNQPTEEELVNAIIDKYLKKIKGLDEWQRRKIAQDMIREGIAIGGLKYERFREIVADAIGLGELSKEEQKKIEGYINNINALQDAENAVFNAKTDKEKADALKNYNRAYALAERSATDLAGSLRNKPDIVGKLTAIMQLNTLTGTSLVKNPFYNIMFQSSQRFWVGLTLSVLDQGIYQSSKILNKAFNTGIIYPDFNNIKNQKYWWEKGYYGFMQSLGQILRGVTNKDYFDRDVKTRQIKPLKAWRDMLSQSEWGRQLLKRMTGKDYDKRFLSKEEFAERLIEGTFGISAEISARLLNVGDKAFRYGADAVAAATEADRLGLKGVDKEIFMSFPRKMAFEYYKKKGLSDEKANEKAEIIERRIIKEGEQAVFQQENALSLFMSAIGEGYDRVFGKDKLDSKMMMALGKIVGRALVVFRKVPLNVAWELINIVVPEIAMLQGTLFSAMSVNKKLQGDESARLYYISAKKWFATALVGMGIQAATQWLLSVGALTGGGDDDDKKKDIKERDFSREYTRPRSINTTKIARVLSGGDSDTKKGDLAIDVSWFGNIGTLAEVQLNIMKDMPKEERDEVARLFGEFMSERLSMSAKYGIENGVFSTSIPLLQAYIDRSGNMANNALINMINTIVNTVHPGTFAQWSRAQLPYEYRIKGDSFWETLHNNMAARSSAYRKFTGHYPPARRSVWGDIIEKDTPVFMQMVGMRRVDKDNFAQPLWDVFEKTHNLDLFPSHPTGSIEYNGKTVKLNASQLDRLQELVGRARRSLVAAYVNNMAEIYVDIDRTKKFNELTEDEKKTLLPDLMKSIYEQGYEEGKQKFINENKDMFPDKMEDKTVTPQDINKGIVNKVGIINKRINELEKELGITTDDKQRKMIQAEIDALKQEIDYILGKKK